MNSNAPKYMIAAVSKMFDLHPQTLRMYERIGLISPTRSRGNTRLYSDADVERIEKILNLTRDMGVNLAGVEVILRLQDHIGDLQREFSRFIECLRSEVANKNAGWASDFETFLVKVQRQSSMRVVDPDQPGENDE